MLSFKSFLSEEVNTSDLPDVFGDLPVEKKSENSKTTVFVVRSEDRLTDRDEIARDLNQAGVKAEVREKSGQSVDPIFIDSGFDTKVVILVKPKSGGIGETTLNAFDSDKNHLCKDIRIIKSYITTFIVFYNISFSFI